MSYDWNSNASDVSSSSFQIVSKWQEYLANYPNIQLQIVQLLVSDLLCLYFLCIYSAFNKTNVEQCICACLLVHEQIVFPKLITTQWCFFNPHQSMFLLFSTIIVFSPQIIVSFKVVDDVHQQITMYKLVIICYPLLAPLMLFANQPHHKSINLLVPIFGFINVLYIVFIIHWCHWCYSPTNYNELLIYNPFPTFWWSFACYLQMITTRGSIFFKPSKCYMH